MLFNSDRPIDVGRKLSLRNGRLPAALLRLSRCNHKESDPHTLSGFALSQKKMEIDGSVYFGGGRYCVDILRHGSVHFDGSRSFCGWKADTERQTKKEIVLHGSAETVSE